MIKNELTKRVFSSLILIPIVVFVIIKGSILFNFFITISFIITAYEWLKMSKTNSWKPRETAKFGFDKMLSESTLGIIGYGRIGKKLASIYA